MTTCAMTRHQLCLKATLLASLAVVTGCLMILAAVPPVSKDALTHHLAVPKLYLTHGGIYEIEHLVSSYYPMNVDLLYIIPLLLEHDTLAKYVHMSLGLATALLLFWYLQKRSNRLYGLLGALLFLSTPIITNLSITVYVDLGLIFFITASILLLFRWAESNFARRYLLAAGLMLGLAAGTKYVGLISLLLLPFMAVLITTYHHGESLPLKTVINSCLLFIGIALVVYAPWPIRNYLWTGNPLFPLFNNLFNPLDAQIQTSLPSLTARKTLYGESWLEILAIPIRIFFEGQDNDHRLFDGKLNPFLLIFSLAALLPSSRPLLPRSEMRCVLFFTIAFFLIVYLQSVMRIRYLAPIIPCLIILSIAGIKNLNERLEDASLPLRFLPVVLVGIMLAYNGVYLKRQFAIVKPLSFISGSVSRDQYISAFRPEYPLIQKANQILAAEDKVLAIFLGDRGYYFDIPVEFDLRDGRSMMAEILSRARSATEVTHILTSRGFSALLINYGLFHEWVLQRIPAEQQRLFGEFLKTRTIMIDEHNGHGLFIIEQL